MTLKFTKMHGLGNDFVVIDGTVEQTPLTKPLLLCLADRHQGVGCDQILLLSAAKRADVDYTYQIFNADGTEVQQCGNGARCVAKYIKERLLPEKELIKLQTSNAIISASFVAGGDVRVNMAVPNFSPTALPMLLPEAAGYKLLLEHNGCLELNFHALSMGNPHVVLTVEDWQQLDLADIGAAVGQHAIFPEGVNVGFMQVVSAQEIKLRVIERGVGETLACGSGACAAVVVGRMLGLLEGEVLVNLLGGKLKIEWPGSGEAVWMTGPAEFVFEGEYR